MGKHLGISVLEPDVLSGVQSALYLAGKYPILCLGIIADAAFHYDGVCTRIFGSFRWTSERRVIIYKIAFFIIYWKLTLLCKAL